MPITLLEIQERVRREANPKVASQLQRFFKTGPGQYGEGDVFLGIRVPDLRRLTRAFGDVPMPVLPLLLASPFHEERMLALLLMIRGFESGDERARKRIYRFYLSNTRHINNWDLVDASAPQIVGAYLHDREKTPLYELARSSMLWERRISMVAAFHDIRRHHFDDALAISALLLADKEDLIHKAAGWMLREIGKREVSVLERFLIRHYRDMPRTMLRYAIEKFPEEKRMAYLKGKV
ncbi:MAG: DNA alkylation repair protein [Desulfobacteraceae bacterium]|jgi:3-methyladenine DNA glycosylase AlkD|nr:MAG: DNA alkylation repair protein [Desulfobacteraceae bacterium]